MRTVILVGLILLLVIAVVESDFAFGDIISFTRKFAKIKRVYKHFAVYVGSKNLFGQGEDKDIFHRIRKPHDGKYCTFGSLAKEPEHQKDNYLDGKLNKSSDADIIKHIIAMIEHCGNYSLLHNNCEHLATYVRYGRAFLYQRGTKVRFMCIFRPGGKACPKADATAENIPEDEVREILDRLHTNSETEAEDMDQDQAAPSN